MGQVFEPLMEQLVEEEGIDTLNDIVIAMAEEAEDYLRINDPESRLLQRLDEHRLKTQGFN